MKNNPFFSIVIPAYNRATFIVKTVQSVLSQTYQNFEVIIVDDGSTDNTSEIIKNNIKDIRVKYYYKENEERGASRNFGLQKSEGEYVFFFDSDDLMLSDHLSTLHSYCQKYPHSNYLATKYMIMNQAGRPAPSELSSCKEGWYDYTFFLKGNPLAAFVCIKRKNPNLHLFIEDRKLSSMEDWIFYITNLIHDKLFLIDKHTLYLVDHPLRSMAFNEVVIAKRIQAMNWITENISLREREQSTLISFSMYFCSIHSYLDNKRMDALRFLWKAIITERINSKLGVLFIKIVLGRKIIKLITNRFIH